MVTPRDWFKRAFRPNFLSATTNHYQLTILFLVNIFFDFVKAMVYELNLVYPLVYGIIHQSNLHPCTHQPKMWKCMRCCKEPTLPNDLVWIMSTVSMVAKQHNSTSSLKKPWNGQIIYNMHHYTLRCWYYDKICFRLCSLPNTCICVYKVHDKIWGFWAHHPYLIQDNIHLWKKGKLELWVHL